MLDALVRMLLRSAWQKADDYVSQPVPPKPDYVSPPLHQSELQQMQRIDALAERTGDIELLTYSINMNTAYVEGNSSRVRQELADAVRYVRRTYSKSEASEV